MIRGKPHSKGGGARARPSATLLRRDPWVDHLIYIGVPLTTRNWLEARYEDPDITWREIDGAGDVEAEMPDGLIEDRAGKPPGVFRRS